MFLRGVVILLTFMAVSTAPAVPAKTSNEHLIKACGGKPAELFFLLDSSSSIWSVDFHKQLKFVRDVIDTFEVSPTKTRVGVASFSYRYHENIELDTFDRKEDVQNAVMNIRQYLGGTYTFDALDGVRGRGLGSSIVRQGVVKIAVVLTDGKSYNPLKTKEAAKRLKDAGVVVFAVGIGSKRNNHFKDELKAIASEPTEKYLFEVGNYGLLKTIKQQLATKACEVEMQDEPAPIIEQGPTCGAKNPADVIFLVDPMELTPSSTDKIHEFISDVTEEFNMNEGNMKVGLESRHCGSGNIGLGEYIKKDELTEAIHQRKHTGMGHMIKRLRTHAFKEENGGRIMARDMAVIFVDDKLYKPEEVLEQARRTMQYDVELFVVAIGDRVDEEQVTSLCSQPVDKHLIRVPSYEELNSSKSRSTFLERFCRGL